MKNHKVILAIFAVQALCAIFFVADILASVLGLRIQPIAWEARELLEIGAAVGLTLGIVLGAQALYEARNEAQNAKERLRRAKSAFHEIMLERFSEWKLTNAERDVAMFAIKGLDTREIAALRGTSEGTVKAQSNAIYRKAGVASRAQLLGILITDITGDDEATAAEKAD
ncbi:LuxR C-terminal-related transcriptional regulator [Pararhodobacter sp. CCB-MM2]|uniref:helix-turn-helix transcriptional regulator n=1 Tax=Pararhodobacter sp. CCB-MM2 TaxID=1786003 RepID=UPI0008376804|nr:LuxR C-terminal-related transcriptional regulator [Pararhodobacter sp. CCB-MM2]